MACNNTNEEIKVTILSITYNHEKYIKQMLDSLIKQKTDFKYKVLIGDDASTDDTANIIRQYADEYPEIVVPVLREKNIGVHRNLYDLLSKIDSDYIAYCEGDDYFLTSDKLQKQVNFMNANTNCSLCFHPVKVFYENNEYPESVFPEDAANFPFTVESLIKFNFIQTNSVMWRRQNYQNMPEQVMPLDWFLHFYHAKYGEIGFLPEVMSAYRKHDGGIWSKFNERETFRKYGIGLVKFYYEVVKLYPESDELLNKIIRYQYLTRKYLSEDESKLILKEVAKKYPDIYKKVRQKQLLKPFYKIVKKIKRIFK